MKRIISIFLLFFPVSLFSQINVSASAIYFDGKSKAGSFFVTNTGDYPVDVELESGYGYLRTDEAGETTFPLDSVAPPGELSLLPWVRFFPKRLSIPARASRTVRVVLNPPLDLPDGEFWGRLLVGRITEQPPLKQGETTSLQLSVRTVFPVALVYRKGDNFTSTLEVQNMTARVNENGVVASYLLTKQGNSAFWGKFKGVVMSPQGEIIAQIEQPLAVYSRLNFEVLMNTNGKAVPPGSRIVYTFDTDRSDLPGRMIVNPNFRLRGEIVVQ